MLFVSFLAKKQKQVLEVFNSSVSYFGRLVFLSIYATIAQHSGHASAQWRLYPRVVCRPHVPALILCGAQLAATHKRGKYRCPAGDPLGRAEQANM